MQGTKPTGRHLEKRLTPAAIRALSEPGLYGDGHGLYLKIDKSGSKRWIQRIVIQGRRRDIGLGSASLVTLIEARETALGQRKVARQGDDPLAAKERSKAVPSFERAASLVHEHNEGTWRNEKHRKQWLSTLENYAFPLIGAKSVAKIDSADILSVLDPIWGTRPETARRIKQRIGKVLQWAIARGYRTDNPADAVQQGLSKHDRSKVRRMPALPYREVSKALETVRASKASAATKLAFELVVHSACRSGEVRKACWQEFDLDNALWEIPGERMKAKKPHVVPLSDAVVSILKAAQALRQDGSDLVFPSVSGKALSDMTLSKLMKDLKIPAVPHGFRASFREWAGEATNHPREVIEHALSHQIPDKAEAAYARSTLIPKRRLLMSDWSGFLATAPKSKADTGG